MSYGEYSMPAHKARGSGVSTFELAFLVVGGLTLATQILQIVLRADLDPNGTNASPAAAMVFAALYASIAVLAVGRRKAVIALARTSPLFVLLLCFPLLSWYWSFSRAQTLSPAIAVIGTGLVGLYLTVRFDLRQIIVVLGLVYALAGIGSVLIAVLLPGIGVMSSAAWAGAWNGLYVHKNSLGAGSAIGTLVLIYAISLTRGPLKLFFIAALLATLLALAESRSATAVVNVAVLVFVAGWSRMAQKWPGTTIPLTVAGMGLLALGILQFLVSNGLDTLFELLGRNADISGRLPLWEVTLEYVKTRPWLGFGYEAFWSPFSSQVEFIETVIRYRPFYSHSGVLETLLNGGIVLLALVVTALLASLVRAFALLMRGERRFYTSFPLVFLVFFIIANITESRILFRNDLIWTVFMAVGFMLAAQVRVKLGARSRPLALNPALR